MASTLTLPRIDDGDDGDDALRDGRVSRFDVERLACGELHGEEKERVERALAADPALKAFFDDVVASDRAFLFEHPPAAFFASAVEQARAPSLVERIKGFFTSAQLVSSVCAAAAVALVVVSPIGGERERAKGGAGQPSVGFFVQEGDVARVGHAGDVLKAGDRIQLAVKDVDKRAMVVVGVDGNGEVSVYARESLTSTAKGAAAPPAKSRLLPASLVLDDTKGAERFFVVYGDEIDDLEGDTLQAAKKLAAQVKRGEVSLDDDGVSLDVGADKAQSSVHIIKR